MSEEAVKAIAAHEAVAHCEDRMREAYRRGLPPGDEADRLVAEWQDARSDLSDLLGYNVIELANRPAQRDQEDRPQ